MTVAMDVLPWLAAGALLGAVPAALRGILAVGALSFTVRHGTLPMVLMLGGFLLAREG